MGKSLNASEIIALETSVTFTEQALANSADLLKFMPAEDRAALSMLSAFIPLMRNGIARLREQYKEDHGTPIDNNN